MLNNKFVIERYNINVKSWLVIYQTIGKKKAIDNIDNKKEKNLQELLKIVI